MENNIENENELDEQMRGPEFLLDASSVSADQVRHLAAPRARGGGMKRLGLSWVIAAGMVGAAIKPLVKGEDAKAPTPVAERAVASAIAEPTPEASSAITWSDETEAEHRKEQPSRKKTRKTTK